MLVLSKSQARSYVKRLKHPYMDSFEVPFIKDNKVLVGQLTIDYHGCYCTYTVLARVR